MRMFQYAKPVRLFAAAIILLASSACDENTLLENLGPVPDVAFSTDATGYVARNVDNALKRYSFRIISRYQNRSTVPVYLARCNPNTPQPLFSVSSADRTTPSAYEQVWACVGHNQQFALLPGATRTDTLEVSGPNTFPSGSNVGFGATSGRFQLYFDVRLAPGDGAPEAPMELRLSNEFVVRTGN